MIMSSGTPVGESGIYDAAVNAMDSGQIIDAIGLNGA